ncbi:DUF6612 family protein [Halobacillus mangrovi]|uniref:Gram-positive cocci surface proteins LPxTG domain-containing protein n=1 Tax=Halobacillus mangrovi TaxID=402384 RepID=A0A1W5ZSD4_9BACI|nr:DUF6612 family protein [Halobacillus mangrovi]ARI76208.1 hypothetical protein HM131_04875 [Halobacillus mangrovi]
MLKKLFSLSVALVVLFVLPFQIAAAEMSAEEILKKSNEAMKGLDSYTLRTVTESPMPMMNEGNSKTMTSEAVSDVTLDPFAMHMTTKMPGSTVESYLTEQGYYAEMPGEGWVKLSDEMNKSIQKMAMADGQLNQALTLAKDMSVQEEEEAYVLTFEGDGQKLLEMSMKMMQSNMNTESNKEMDSMMKQLLEDVEIKDVSYQMTIDKENHYLTSMMMDLEMTIKTGEEPATISQSTKMTLENFNGVDPIEIPQEVLDQAKPLEETIKEGGEMPDTATSYPTSLMLGGVLILLGGGMLLYRRKTTA